MCRFVLYLGCEISLAALVTEPENSIIHQSFKSRERKEPLNGDGFGIGWYVPEISETPAIFKDITPAWNNTNLLNLARVTRSSCILAHVRAATRGLSVIRLNCHPFSDGPFSFMHNGKIGGFAEIRRSLLARLSDEAFKSIKGSTDSEYLFALFLDHFNKTDIKIIRPERMASALASVIEEVECMVREAGITAPSTMNLAVTDGINALATRYVSNAEEDAPSLYVHTGGSFFCKEGHIAEDMRENRGHAVLIASEPLTNDAGWQRVKPGSMVVVTKELLVETRTL